MENKIDFYYNIEDGKVHFRIPQNPELESQVRAQVKTQSVKRGPKEFYFRRGIIDAVNSILTGQPRKHGTPMVELKDLINGRVETMTCHEAKYHVQQFESLYEITQISGDKLPKDYFNDEDNTFTTQPAN